MTDNDNDNKDSCPDSDDVRMDIFRRYDPRTVGLGSLVREIGGNEFQLGQYRLLYKKTDNPSAAAVIEALSKRQALLVGEISRREREEYKRPLI
jgi:hypothetical protein